MTRRRQLVRRVVLGAGVVFAATLVLSYRKPGTKTEEAKDAVAETLLEEAKGVRDRMRFRDFEYVETRATEGTYRLRASEALKFEDKGAEIFRLKDVVFESRDETPRGASTGIAIRAPRAEFIEGSKAFRVFDGVEMFGEGTALKGSSFHYEPAGRVFVSDGPVRALRDRLVGDADSGSVETREGNLRLEGAVRLRGRAEDGREIDLKAPKVTMSRGGTLSASGGVEVKTPRFVLRSASLDRTADAGGDHMRASGAAELLLSPDSRVPSAVTARGETIDLAREASGEPTAVDVATPAGLSRLDVAPAARSNARRALAPEFHGRFRDGRLAEVTVPSQLDASEAASPGGPPGSGLRRLVAGFARFSFAADGTSLEVATFRQGVLFTEGTRAVLKAPEGTLRAADDTAVFSGTAGTPAEYRDEKGSLVARTITYERREDRLDAAGQVHATYAGGGRTGLLGGSPNAPFFSESDTLQLQRGRSRIVLTGNVRAWQKENVLRCAKLELDDASRTLHAEGNVRAFFRRETPAAPGGGGKAISETINATGDVLTHREADRMVRIEGHTSMISGSWLVNSDVTDIRLAPDRSVEFAEARGAVVVEDRAEHRRGEGAKATWRPQSEAVTLEGAPATALDGKGNRTAGALLTFRQGRSQVDVETSGQVPSETVLKPEKS